eukprot:1157623-Pelagomonas_calceolata.AAC.6
MPSLGVGTRAGSLGGHFQHKPFSELIDFQFKWVQTPGNSRQDGDFSDERFRNTVNAALANNIGNMLNRSLNLLKKFCKSESACSTILVGECVFSLFQLPAEPCHVASFRPIACGVSLSPTTAMHMTRVCSSAISAVKTIVDLNAC